MPEIEVGDWVRVIRNGCHANIPVLLADDKLKYLNPGSIVCIVGEANSERRMRYYVKSPPSGKRGTSGSWTNYLPKDDIEVVPCGRFKVGDIVRVLRNTIHSGSPTHKGLLEVNDFLQVESVLDNVYVQYRLHNGGTNSIKVEDVELVYRAPSIRRAIPDVSVSESQNEKEDDMEKLHMKREVLIRRIQDTITKHEELVTKRGDNVRKIMSAQFEHKKMPFWTDFLCSGVNE